MAEITKRTQLEIYEVRTDDGGYGLKIGADSPIIMGHTAGDLMSLLWAVFPDAAAYDPDDPEPVDTELKELAAQYLDPWRADERRRELKRRAKEWYA